MMSDCSHFKQGSIPSHRVFLIRQRSHALVTRDLCLELPDLDTFDCVTSVPVVMFLADDFVQMRFDGDVANEFIHRL